MWVAFVQWGSILFLWYEAFRLRRARQHVRSQDMAAIEMSKLVGLTQLQVQSAMDGAMATFNQRIHEMQQHRGIT